MEVESEKDRRGALGAPPPAAVVMRGIVKRFPGVLANDRVDFEAAAGEVHALLGENGAGKSTLSNILTGLYRPDAGEIFLDGEPVQFHSPRDALDARIFMVHQHFRLVEPFTVAENVVLGDHRGEGRTFRLRHRAIEERVAELSKRYGLAVDPRARVWQLSLGEQQRVEILKALYREARILILDEPTAVLTPQEADALFETLREMASEGRTVVFISHKLHEVKAVADRVTVLRGGRSIATVPAAEATLRSLASLMVGRELDTAAAPRSRTAGDPVLELEDVWADSDRGGSAVRGASLVVRGGEIVAVAGVAGNGQRELAETVAGMRPATRGAIRIAGKAIRGGDPRAAIAAGVAYVPEDRLGTGVAPSLSIAANLALKGYREPHASRGPLLRLRRMRERALELIAHYRIAAPGPSAPARLLSGGNLQKVVLAREFSGRPRLLIAAAPTRGLDVGAIETVHAYLREAAADGVGVLLISEDLDEILTLADRIAVMYEGAVVGETARAEADVEEIGLLMAGGQDPRAD
ncbi:MAG TPA: ABC transporter ATP-binding protein [Gaiellaceae bacterium]|nr:ABC transporter ATP-binding protein [Gaiellaceae bacterium]